MFLWLLLPFLIDVLQSHVNFSLLSKMVSTMTDHLSGRNTQGHPSIFNNPNIPFPHFNSNNQSITSKMTAHNNNPISTLNFSLSPSEIITLAKDEIETSSSFFSQLLSIPTESRAVPNVLLPWARWEGEFR